MLTVEKVTISLPKELVAILRKEIPAKKRSKFIAETIKERLEALRKETLRKAYIDAYDEIKHESKQLSGTLSDGIS